MTEKEVDVLIVGMGPAGSSAAKVCAEAGLNVLGLEKRAEIGSPKRCGEGLSKSALKRMGIKLDKKWVTNEILGATIYAPNGKFVRIDYPDKEGWIIERKIFDKWLAYRAARAGAKILAGAGVLDLIKENGKIAGARVRAKNREFYVKAKITIACDGVESKTARMAGLNTTLKLTDIASCAQFEMAGIDIDSKRIELYFGNEIAPQGYAWIFPKGKDVANVGIGVRKPAARDTAYNYLKKFIASMSGLKKGSVIEVNSGGVPVGGFLENMVSDNLIVVGDAAHQVNPIHGGGIAEAYLGGRIAGEVAAEAIKKGDTSRDFLSQYNKIWWKTRGNKLKKTLKLREVVESLSDEDLNWLANYLSGQDLVGLAEASGFKKLAKLLMRKPKLVKLAAKLI